MVRLLSVFSVYVSNADVEPLVVNLYLVSDRSSSADSTGSLDVTLYGENQVVLKTTKLLSDVLRKKISKMSLPLDNEAVVKAVKIEAAEKISLRIFEVQTMVNENPTTIFSAPIPRSVTFLSRDETSSGIVSLWFVPVTEYLTGTVLSQCLFDLAGRCGYHADLEESTGMLFLAEDSNEPIVAAKSPVTPAFRRLTEVEVRSKFVPRSLSTYPSIAGRFSYQRAALSPFQPGTVLPSDERVVTSISSGPVEVRLEDVLDDVKEMPEGIGSFDLVSVEASWNADSAFDYARIGGASSRLKVVDNRSVTIWRLRRCEAVMNVFVLPGFTGRSGFIVTVGVNIVGKMQQYSKTFLVTVETDLQQQSSTFENAMESKLKAENVTFQVELDMNEARRLDSTDSVNSNVKRVELQPLAVDLQDNEPFRLVVLGLFPNELGTSAAFCETSFTIFSVSSAIEMLATPRTGAQNVTSILNPVLRHFCNETLSATLLANVKQVQAQIEVVMMNSDDTILAIASIPVTWSVVSQVAASFPSQILLGAHNILAGGVLELTLHYSDALASSAVTIVVLNCSSFDILTVGSANSTREECTFLLKDADSTEPIILSGIKIAEHQNHPSIVYINVIISQYALGEGGTSRTVTPSNTLSYTAYFCGLTVSNGGPLIFRKGVVNTVDLSSIPFTVLGSSFPDSQNVRSVAFILDSTLLPGVGNFSVNNDHLEVENYNVTASIVTLYASNGNNYSYLPMQYKRFLVDVIVEWEDLSDDHTGCFFVPNIVVSILPSFSQPIFAAPYSFSRKVLQGESAQITIPMMATMNPDIECITLAVSVNTTDDDEIVIKRDGVTYSSSPKDQRYFLLVQRSDIMDSASRVILSVTPNGTFTGTLQFDVTVSAIGILDNAYPFEELGAEYATIRGVNIEWIPRADSLSEPTAAGKAIYRSLPTKLQGDSTLSFRYLLSSGFSTISTYVVLNSTETRWLWSSDSSPLTESTWNYAEALIKLPYVSTAEIVFHGEVSEQDALYLKAIAVRDYTQESMVGDILFVRATGGMVYIDIVTANSTLDPVLYRAYVNDASNEAPVLRFTGDAFQYLGCESTSPMYQCVGSSGVSYHSPSQCHSLCSSTETQLKITSESIVRSIQTIAIPVAGDFTIEFWVYLDNPSTSFIYRQLLLLYGSQEGALSIMINGDLVISRCNNQLRVPHGLPLHKWTHLAFVFTADNKVIILIQGVKMAEGLLSKSNCRIPTYAYLQLGRDALDILSDSYALKGGMDEIRVWKIARDPADINATYKHNVGGSALILFLLFNSAASTNWLPSVADGSSSGTDFMVQNVEVTNTRPIQELGISGDGSCYYRLFTSTVSSASNICDKPCELHGILRTCGSKITATIASVYRHGSIGIGGLSPLTDYEVSVEFVTENGKEYEVTQKLSASTSNVTVPGVVEYIGVVERSAELLEIHWSPVNDDGGSDILRYLIFFDGVKVREIADGNLSATFSFTDIQGNYKVTIQAENAQGIGSQSNSLFLEGLYSDPAPQPPQEPAVNRVSGGSVDLVLDESTRLAIGYRSSVAVIEQREALSASFTPSIFKLNGTSATVYNLRHNTVYIFRLSVINVNGVQSAFSSPKAVKTGDRGSPSKTPQPSIVGVTGGSIKLVLNEPLDTGGLPIAQFNLFILYDGSFTKLKSIPVSSTSATTALVTLGADGSPLRPQTSYIFKALALQANVVCDTLTTDDLASDIVTTTTGDAATPIPPSVSALLLLSGCTALLTASPPDDLGGAGITGMTFGVFLSTGVLYQRFTVQLYPGEITLRNLLANTSYSVRAAFYTDNGDSEFGQALNFTTLGPSLPGKLKRLAVTDVGPCWAHVQWEGPEDTGCGFISGYLLYQRTTTTTSQELIYNGSSDSTTTSYRAERLLAKTAYIFSVVPINQYGLAGLDANVIVTTTSDAEVPFAPTSVTQTQVSGGYVELSFVEPFSTGGFALKSLQYLARLETMSSCYDSTTHCSGCTHASDASGAIMPVDTTSCFSSDSINCYLNADTKCGVLHAQTETKACSSTTQSGMCRVEGLTYLTTYVVSIAAKNSVGRSSFSDRIVTTTTETIQPGVPQLLLVSATGGSIALQWKLPTDTGGEPIARMHLSVDGTELFNTESALIYTHCGGLVANTDYTYTIEIENAAGLVNRATSTFTTTALTPVGPLAISKTFVGMETAKFGVTVPCDDGGSNGGVSLSYRVFHVGDETLVTHGLVGCCSISINGLEGLIDYRIEVQGVSSTLTGKWSAMNFTTLSGIPSNPDTKMMFVTATTLKLELVAPSNSGGSSLTIEAIATRASTGTVVFQDSLICSVADQVFGCPHTLSIDNIDSNEHGFTYIVSVRAVGDGGSSAWINQSYDLDDGSPGKIGFAGSTIRGTEGKSIDVNVTRIYGTTGYDQADFTISAGFIAPKWSCEQTSSGATCSINAGGANSGHVVFEPGDYLKTITISSFDDFMYEAEAVSLNLALASTTTTALSNTHCKVIFDDNGDAGALAFEKAMINVVENQGRLRIIIMRTGGSSGTVSVTMTSTVSSSIIGYQLNQVIYFADGINKATRDIDIRSSDAYEVRHYTVMLSNPTNGATASGNLSVIVQDKGDLSLPGLPQPEAGLRTGGCITLVLKPPKFLGGSSVTVSYLITVLQPITNFYKTSTTEASSIDVCDLEFNTIYTINVRASNAYGSSGIRSLNISTRDISAPTEVVQFLADTVTSGYASLSWLPPLDKGGVKIDAYNIRVITLRYNMTRVIQAPGSEISLSVGYLEVGMPYAFAIRGVNSGGLEGPEVSLYTVTGDEEMAPQQPPPPELILATGGALNVSILAPLDCGGLPLLSYVVSIARHIGGTLEYRQYVQNSIQSSTYDDQIVANVSIYGLLSNSEYFIIVSVQNGKGWSSPSDEKSFFTTGPTRVGAISPPVIVLQDPGELTLNWSAPLDTGGLNVVGYKIQSRRRFPNGSWSSTEIVYENRKSLVQTALISNILPNTQYAFSVSGYNFRTLCRPDEDVSPSDELLITTQDASVPSQPKNLRVIEVTGGSVTLAWDPPRSSGGEALLWFLINGSTKGSPLQLLANVSGSAPTSLTLYGFIASFQYEFAIAGENARGYGLYSAAVDVTTSGISAPGAPKQLRQISVPSGGTILLTWEPPDDSGGAEVKEYKVIRDGYLIGVVLPDEGTVKFQDQDKIIADKSYDYSVFSSNDVVSSSTAATLTAHSATGSVPATPSATAEPGGGFIKLSLTAAPDTGGLPRLRFELTILRGTSIVYDTTDTTFTVTGLYAETEYYIAIRSVNSAGKSESYTLGIITSDATVPDKPSVPRLLKVAGGHLTFGVDAPANFGGGDVLGYNFYVNGTLGVVEKLSSNEYDLLNLTALTFYAVTVSAKNLKGESSQSDAIVVSTEKVTVPGLVRNVSASHTPDSIVLEWKMPLDTGGAASISYAISVTTPDGTIQTSSDTETLSQSGLNPATEYIFQVSVMNTAGSGQWSTSLSVTTDPVSPGVINFMSRVVVVSENETSVTLTLLRTEGGFMAAKCFYYTLDGTALAGDQYVETSGEIDFDRSSISESVQVPILNNEVADDSDKYFYVLIKSASSDSGEIGEMYRTEVLITDDGDAGFLAFRQDDYTVSESVSGLLVDLVRSVKFSGNSVVEVDAVGIPGGAVEGVDFVIVNKTIEFADQQKQASINISITNDLTYQVHKVFKLKLRVVSGRITIDDSKAVVTVEILDDGDISPPELVTAVEVLVISGGAVNLSWVAPGYLGAKAVVSLAYTVRVMEVQTGAIKELPTRTASITIPDLHARAAYTVAIVAYNGYLLGNYTTPVNFLMGAPSPPSMPLDVQVVAVTGGMATLVWTVPFDSGGSPIGTYRVNVSAKDGVFVGSYSSSGQTVLANNLSPSTTYSATVEAISRAELVGAASTAISLTTTSASIPGKPTALTTSNETGGVFLVEMAPPLDIGGAPILSFTLLMTSAQYPNVFRQVYQGPTSSFLATKLTFSTRYKLQYKVTNSVGTSELSDVFTATTKYLSPPGQAQNLVSLSRTGGSITFSWTPPVDFGGVDVTAYDISFFLGYEIKAQYRQRVAGISPQATSVTAKVVGLIANSTYGFSVSGVNDATVCEDPSTLLSRTIVYDSTDPSVSIPDTPSNLTVVSSTSGMQTIKWTASEDTGGGLLLSYALYSSTGALLYNDTSTTFTLGSLIKDTTYGYKVVAWNEMGTSTPSPLVVATTKAVIVAPSQPRDFTKINSTGGSINLTWKAPLDSGGDNVSGYKLQRNGVWRADIPAGGPTIVFLDDQGLVASKEYVYVVQANNSIGLGAVSQTLRTSTSEATVPSPPTRLDVVASGGNMTATWVAASNSGGIDLASFHFIVKPDTSSTGFSTSTTTSQLTYTVFGVRAKSSYMVSVTSKNAIGESLEITQIVVNGAAVPPAAPPVPEQITDTSGLQAWMIMLRLYLPVDDGGSPISRLNLYQNGERKSVYLVEASTNQAELGDPTSRSMLVQVGPLHAATSYYFAVSALSSEVTAGEGARSDTLKVLMSPATLPSTPTNVAVSLRTSFSVVLIWDASIDTGGDDVVYEIAYTNINTTENGQTESNKTKVEVPKLIPGDVYSFRVRARNSAGVSGWTADIFAETDVTQRGVVVFSVNTLTVYENVSSVTIQLRRENGSSSTVTGTYAVGTGTATEGKDYSLPPESARSLTFIGELTVQSFEVNIINDETYQPSPRTVNLTLTDTTPGRSDPFPSTNMIINILDDGDAGTIGFVESEVSIAENARILPLQLQRLKGKSSAVSARVVLFTGLESTTQPEVGFRLPSTTVDFINGQTSSPASIVIKDNDVYNFPYLYFYLTSKWSLEEQR
ncbi:hypothetical protein DVH05_008034 [Phytophthora capsici]|nr:hypothetical protein DVH05_008034 [Phytophthora capsici]